MKKLLRGLSSARAAAPTPARPASTERFEVLADIEEAGTDWYWATDAEGRLSYISASAAQRFGVPTEALVGQPLATLFETDPEGRSDRSLQFQLGAHSRLADVTVRLVPARLGEGVRPTWWALSGNPKHDGEGHFAGYRGSARDITTEYERRIEDSRLAEFDSLTGLANRHRLSRQLDRILAAYKAAGRACALMMLDLDRFKAVNDTLGHQAGDELLCQVAERLQRVIGSQGEVGRLGGDEFQIILPDLEDRGKLGELATRIIGIVSQPYHIDDNRAVIGTSVGMAVAPFDGVAREDLVQAADLALYAAKHGGRGAYRFYSSDLRDEKDQRRSLEEDLRIALAQVLEGGDAIDLHYQPVVRTADNVVTGFEALLRWDHPARGPLEPEAFVPVAEDCGLIGPLGQWALRRACRDAVTWPESVRVSVNVSPAQFADAGFPDVVANALDEAGLAPDRLELELTEAIFMGESEATDRAFRALKAIGVRLALDDFGTGYSSLSYLRAAPFDRLKVDRSFVEACTVKDNNSARIIAAIIGLSDALGLETTVEGVEAFDQLRLVCEKGARFVQGFLYSPPLNRETVLARIGGEGLRIAPEGPDRHRPERRSVFRRIGVIHGDHRYSALLRDLSATGARIDGLVGVPEGAGLVLDLGGGQLAISTVIRSNDATIGVEFEIPLVSDGAGGLVTRHRVSPFALAAASREAPSSAPAFLEVDMFGAR